MSDPTNRKLQGRSSFKRFNPFSSLRHRDFRFVWSSEMLSLWGTEMETLILAWFVLTDTGSPLQVGLIGAARFGGILLSPIYGSIVDRFDRRKIQVFARAVSAGMAAVLMGLVLADEFVIWHAYVIVGLSSLVRTLGIIVTEALSADSVPGGKINNAMGLNRATIDLSRIVGSLTGGWIMSTLGLGSAYVVVVALYVGSTVAAFFVSARTAPDLGIDARGLRGYATQIRQGMRHVSENRIIGGLLFYAFLIEFTMFPLVNELITALGDELYGADENGVGVMRAVASAGALFGALVTGAYPSIRRAPRLLFISVVIWHFLSLPLVIDMSYGSSLIVLFTWGIFGGIAFVALMVSLLQSASAHYRGRIMGLRVLAVYGLPLGLLMGGWIAEEHGVKTMIWAHALIGLVMAAISIVIWPQLWSHVSAIRSEMDHDETS